MSRRTPPIAQRRARLAPRPLASFSPAQRRLLLALIEAGATTPAPPLSGQCPRAPAGPARP